MIKRLLLTLIAAVVLSPLNASAVQINDLYQAWVPVADQGISERRRAMREGLVQVLKKVTGRADAGTNPQVMQAMERAESYMSRFGYQSEPARDTIPEQLKLKVAYSPSVIDRLVRRAGLPVWPANRPQLLVWMVSDMPGEGRQHVSREQMPDAHRFLERAMAARGGPLLTPLLDLEDQLTLSARDAWAFNEDQLAAAARRYDADHWLVLRFYQTQSGDFRGSVQLASGASSGFAGNRLNTLQASSLKELIDSGVDIALDQLAAIYSFVPTVNAERVSLRLENVVNYSNYKAVVTLFEGLEMVRNVEVAGAEGSVLDLSLEIDGTRDALLDTLRRDRHLSEVVDFSSDNPGLRFRWR